MCIYFFALSSQLWKAVFLRASCWLFIIRCVEPLRQRHLAVCFRDNSSGRSAAARRWPSLKSGFYIAGVLPLVTGAWLLFTLADRVTFDQRLKPCAIHYLSTSNCRRELTTSTKPWSLVRVVVALERTFHCHPLDCNDPAPNPQAPLITCLCFVLLVKCVSPV